ncbi:MAG: DUF349 domain-containing protein, partial [Bacteroidales bacterium]
QNNSPKEEKPCTNAANEKQNLPDQEDFAAASADGTSQPLEEKETGESHNPGSPSSHKPATTEKMQPEEQAEEQKPTQKGKQEEDTKQQTEEATSGSREFYDFGEDTSRAAEEEDEPDTLESKAGEGMPGYETYSREALVQALEDLVSKENTLEYKQNISLIKVAYLKITDNEKAEALEKESGKKSDKEPEKEPEKAAETEAGTEAGKTAAGELEKDTAAGSKQQATQQQGKAEEHKDKLEERYQKAFLRYKEKRAQFLKEQEKIQHENLQKKQAILEQLRELINSEETLKKTYDDFKALQEQWKEIGLVPKTEVNELWKNYHFLVEKFFDKVKINKELRDLDLRKNLEYKIGLCERAEELILESSINKSFKELQELHEKYRQTGPVPDEHKEQVWSRFKSATEKIHERRQKHYWQQEEQQQKNLDAKTALCEKAEEILKRDIDSLKTWNTATGEVRELMKVWRSIGFVPRQYNDSIWNRFKTSVDDFFDRKKDYFKQLKEEQLENYNRKLNLCVEAEALQDSTDWKNTSRKLISLQKEWKSIGPVSRKHSDKLWKRFRAANDKFFNNKSEYFKNIKANENENLKQKEALIEKIKTHQFGEDKNENLSTLKELQRQWMELGFVPFDKKDKIQKEYQEAINKRMDELSISRVEVNNSQYKSHVEKLKNMQGGDRQLHKERTALLSKIRKLKEDVQLWENNTGFLANTKNANVLKEEFQNKIDRARKEIALLEARIAMMDKKDKH